MRRNLSAEERAVREAAAYREAGHAVTAWSQAIMLQALSVRVADRDVGRNVWNDALRNVDFDWVKEARSTGLVERLAAVVIAGPVAQRLHAPGAPRGTVYSLRVASARKLVSAAGRDGLNALRQEIERYMKQPAIERAVQTLSAELVTELQMSGEDATRIIEEAVRRRG